jgi:CBS domain-containing protein
MTRKVVTLKRNETLSIADKIMRLERIRHLPVLDDDGRTLVGVVSQRDLFRGALATALGYGEVGQTKILNSLVVKEVMSTDVVTTAPERALHDAARIMVERKIGCLPVLEEGKLIGILTESDFVAFYARTSGPRRHKRSGNIVFAE